MKHAHGSPSALPQLLVGASSSGKSKTPSGVGNGFPQSHEEWMVLPPSRKFWLKPPMSLLRRMKCPLSVLCNTLSLGNENNIASILCLGETGVRTAASASSSGKLPHPSAHHLTSDLPTWFLSLEDRHRHVLPDCSSIPTVLGFWHIAFSFPQIISRKYIPGALHTPTCVWISILDKWDPLLPTT